MKTFLIAIALQVVLCQGLLAQWSLFGDVKLPSLFSNAYGKKNLEPIVAVDGGIQRLIYKGLSVGVGGHYLFMQTDDFQITGDVNGSLYYFAPIVVLAMESTTERSVMYKGSLKYGFGNLSTTSKVCNEEKVETKQFAVSMVEPSFSVSFRSSQRLAFLLTIGYAFVFHELTPEQHCIEELVTPTQEDLEGNIRMLNVGFGFAVKLGALE